MKRYLCSQQQRRVVSRRNRLFTISSSSSDSFFFFFLFLFSFCIETKGRLSLEILKVTRRCPRGGPPHHPPSTIHHHPPESDRLVIIITVRVIIGRFIQSFDTTAVLRYGTTLYVLCMQQTTARKSNVSHILRCSRTGVFLGNRHIRHSGTNNHWIPEIIPYLPEQKVKSTDHCIV